MKVQFCNQNNTYPIVLIPNGILDFINTKVDENYIANELNIAKPPKKYLRIPSQPSKTFLKTIEKSEIEKTEFTGCLIPIVIVSMLLTVRFTENFTEFLQYTAIWIVFFIAFGSFCASGEFLFRFVTKKTYANTFYTQQEYDALHNEYLLQIANYNVQLQIMENTYAKELKLYLMTIANNKENIIKQLYLKKLNPVIVASRGSLSIKRGLAELRFLEQITSELKSIIFVDMVPKSNNSWGRNTYNPDFTLICERTNLHIDIEIDEPYTIKDKTPIHYINGADEDRNNFFLSNNWCVLRFTERQIIENTTDCIDTIKSVYDNIINCKNYYKTALIKEKRWTYEDSHL